MEYIQDIWYLQTNAFPVTSRGSAVLNILAGNLTKVDYNYSVMRWLDDLVDTFFVNNQDKWIPVETTERQKNIINYNDKNYKQIREYSDFYEDEMIENLGLSRDAHDLSIYLRYGHQVDYPELAELLMLFLARYVHSGYTKYFSGIRIVPRNKDNVLLPSDYVIQKPGVRCFPDVKKDAFLWALHIFATPYFLSNSSNTANEFHVPAILSRGMVLSCQKYQCFSTIELEEAFRDRNIFKVNQISVEHFLNIIILDIKNIEHQIDLFIKTQN